MFSARRTAPFALAFLLAAPAARADVTVVLRDGRVSISAKDATLRQILAEWARVGQTRIVNAERVPGGPMTIELVDVPEAQALDVLLGSLSGYLAAPRAAASAPNASRFDRILVMPATAPAASSVRASAPPPTMTPRFEPPQVLPQPDEPDEDVAPQRGPGPVFNVPPPPQPGQGQPAPPSGPLSLPAAPGTTPAAATPAGLSAPASTQGTAVPGMMVPTPQPTAPQQPGVRRGEQR